MDEQLATVRTGIPVKQYTLSYQIPVYNFNAEIEQQGLAATTGQCLKTAASDQPGLHSPWWTGDADLWEQPFPVH